jgi:hypothetical protein
MRFNEALRYALQSHTLPVEFKAYSLTLAKYESRKEYLQIYKNK